MLASLITAAGAQALGTGVAALGFTGSRHAPAGWLAPLTSLLANVPAGVPVYVGDAAGVDALVRQARPSAQVFRVAGGARTPRALVARSIAMVQAVAAQPSSLLVAVPSGPCPANIVPAPTWRSGATPSGTWSSAALAVGLGVRVVVLWLGQGELRLPAWVG